MITFACPSCQKQLAVKDDLAGKKAKCPGCGQVGTIPAPGDVLSQTLQISHDPEATQGPNQAGAGHDATLTAFLAPSQSGDELGRLGPYRIRKILGHGGMGVVFLAEDPKLRRQVAIKAMLPNLGANPSVRQRFLREAQAMAAVKHDHIATIHQVDEERGVPFLVMEFLAGESLDERLKREGTLPLGEVLRIGREIVAGLEAAHATGLIHRDIKPANIWLEAPRGRVKILDFGLARAAAQDASLTQEGAIVGTPSYMAPEQARGEITDARSDFFSLGCVLYRMCTGREPFRGNDTVSTLLAVVSDQPTPPVQVLVEIPPALSDLVMRLLEKDPDRRPKDAAEVAEALGAVEWTPKPTPKLKPGRTRAKLVVALCLLALVPLVGWLATVILRVETATGTLVVQIDDPETEARIKGGKLILTGPDGKVRYTLVPSERDRKIDAGPYRIRVEGADGLVLDTPEFTLKKDGKVTVRVTAEPKAVVKNAAPDRTAAEYVLSLGGTVRLNEQENEIRAKDGLPQEAFQLTRIQLLRNENVSDTGLANMNGCKNVTALNLSYTKVSDAGLASFKDCKNLTILDLNSTQVSDTGLAYFKDCKNLIRLGLLGTRVSDAGLAHLKDCKKLVSLGLGSTQVSDAGLAHLKECRNLTHLYLQKTQVSDTGLAHFKDCKNLRQLDLSSTQVSDAGLVHLKDCKNLPELDLRKTKVTAKGIAELGKALPKCKIEWDGGVNGPTLDPDRTAAEYVLSIGGTVRVNEQDIDIRAKDGLPRETFRLTRIYLPRNEKVSDAGLANMNGCKNLTYLDLSGTPVSDAGLAHFKDCKNLTWLVLAYMRVSDAGLSHFKDCKNLTVLNLGGTQLSDAGLANFKECKNLTYLHLENTKINDAGLANFKDCKNLTTLGLSHTQVSDAGLAHVKDSKNLTQLFLEDTQVGDVSLALIRDYKDLTQLSLVKTKVTGKGIAELGKVLPKCRIEWDGGVTGPTPDRTAAEYVLSIGGTVRVNDQENEIRAKDGLPQEAFRLTGIGLQQNQKVSDAGLANLKGCKNLTSIILSGTRMSDAGLAHLKDCTNLTVLHLGGTQVSDAGLALLKDCKSLTVLHLWGTQVSDAVLAHLKDCKGLTFLNLSGTQVSDVGLAQLSECGNLTQLNLSGTPVSDVGLAHLKDCKGLTFLNLSGTQVSDVGLAYFKGCKSLRELGLSGTKISDAGLAHLKDCKNLTVLLLGGTQVGDESLALLRDYKNLTQLSLGKTRVTAKGIAELKTALPKCKIE